MRDFLDYYFSPRRFIGDVRAAALVRDRGNPRSFDFTPNYVISQSPFCASSHTFVVRIRGMFHHYFRLLAARCPLARGAGLVLAKVSIFRAVRFDNFDKSKRRKVKKIIRIKSIDYQAII
jgi:hypothetical protein